MKKIVVLPGDGIGPEVMAEALKVLDKVKSLYNLDVQIEEADFGGIAIDKHGSAFPDETKAKCYEADAILLGSIGGPKWESLPPEQQPERAGLLPLRKELMLYANIRPVSIYPEMLDASPLKRSIIEKGVDIVIVRELTGGLYFGQPKKKSEEVALDTLVYRKDEIVRIARLAFELARKREKKLTSIDKANVLTSMVFWRETVTEVSKEYPDVELQHMYVDNAAMQIIKNPAQFDVLLACNMFGDIISDEASVLAGSLGLLPSASVGEKNKGVFEPIGGSAPDIAGKGIANPIAQILSLAYLLRITFNEEKAAQSIENAIKEVIKQYRTPDIAGGDTKIVNTKEMGDLIVEAIK